VSRAMQNPYIPKVGAPAEDEETRRARDWLENVYQGDQMAQLTVRAVVTGAILGGVMAVSNLYVGMKTGWGLGVTITACVLAFALFSSLQAVFPRLAKNHFTILENNMMSSTASAAGYMSSSIFVSAVPALYLATGKSIGWFELSLWAGAVSFLGVFMAIPMKRQQINIDQLPFPSGIATAETLKAMHSAGDEAKRKAMSLAGAGGVGGLLALLKDGFHKIPENFIPAWNINGVKFSQLTIGFEFSSIMIAAGAIMGMRAAVSLLLAGIACYGILGPFVINEGWCDPNRFRQTWALWPGVGLLVTSGLTVFFLRWRTIARAFAGMGKMFGGGRSDAPVDPVAHLEAPQSWFLWGTAVSGGLCVAIGAYYFEIPWWTGIIAVILTFFLALVASRATGETDITPTGAMGKITQLVFGLLVPKNITTNLMSASLTGGAAIHSADLLTDLKCGYILGANPRKQLIAQLFGVMAGTLFVVPAYTMLIKPEEIGSDKWPAPAAQIWAGVAKVLSEGLEHMPQGAVTGALVGGLIGIVLALLEEYVPKQYKKYTPSSTGIGIAFVVPFFNSFSMFLGALLVWLWARRNEKAAESYAVPIASGLIAGESLIAVGIAAVTGGG
jgi:uncharacterized oligopeptide transporter (OPT) family protein